MPVVRPTISRTKGNSPSYPKLHQQNLNNVEVYDASRICTSYLIDYTNFQLIQLFNLLMSRNNSTLGYTDRPGSAGCWMK